jgi:uncharacterized protein with GYD domain
LTGWRGWYRTEQRGLYRGTREPAMAKFLIKASYNTEGIRGVLKGGGSARVTAVEKALAGLGGSVESFYFGFGGSDVYVVVEVPGNVEAAAMAATVGASGAMASYETVVLLTPEEIDQAAKAAVDYSPPGS